MKPWAAREKEKEEELEEEALDLECGSKFINAVWWRRDEYEFVDGGVFHLVNTITSKFMKVNGERALRSIDRSRG